MDEVRIIGCGGHARSVADVLLDSASVTRVIFVDKNAKSGEQIFGMPVRVCIEPEFSGFVVMALGNNQLRHASFLELSKNRFLSVISRRAYLGRECEVGKAVFIAHGAHVGPLATIGHNTIINTSAVIDHESSVGISSHVGPHATVAGRSRVGDRVFLGVGSTVIDGISICSDVVIGANSTVVESIAVPGTYVGSPAKKVR